MKIVINRCFGGFGLSPLAIKLAVVAGVPHESYPHKRGTEFDAQEKLLEDLGHGFQIWGRPKGAFSKVVKDGAVVYFRGSEIALRSHPGLVKIVEELGEKSWGECAELAIIEVPAGVSVHIEEYDGNEHIAESHRTWR